MPPAIEKQTTSTRAMPITPRWGEIYGKCATPTVSARSKFARTTGFREQEVMFLRWSDLNFELRTVRVTAKPELRFYPKRWEDREVPAPVELIEELRKHPHRPKCQFVFPSPTGNREQHMLRRVSIALRHSQMEFTEFYSLRVC